jgi:hypothetical protein
MTLPGFSAETSLYKTGIHYRLTGRSVQAGGIVPQQFAVPLDIPCVARCRRRCAGNPLFEACFSQCVENCF